MERIVITIRPAGNEKLDVSDAMQQVIDYFKLLNEAKKAAPCPEEPFTWRLERASTNSPFTVEAVAESVRPHVDISQQAQQVKREFASAIRGLLQDKSPAWWMDASAIQIAGSIFRRNTNGIANTEIEIAPDDKLVIDREQAIKGADAVSGISAISGDDIHARTSFGEVRGIMVGAGSFYNSPAIQIRTEQYPGIIYCILPAKLVKEFGGAHEMKEIWEGRSIGVTGKLIYVDGGKLARIQVEEIRELPNVPRISLDDFVDKDFTMGLDPVEYLRRLHEGELA